MAVKTLGSRINTESFSHASGSVPALFSIHQNLIFFFPRKWECSDDGNRTKRTQKLFPTQVGVFHQSTGGRCSSGVFSHASGSVPIKGFKTYSDVFFSHASGSVPYFWLCGSPKPPFFPRKWECSWIRNVLTSIAGLFPT